MQRKIIVVSTSSEEEKHRTINTTALHDPTLSWKAKGIHTYLRSLPTEHTLQNQEQLVEAGTDGKDGVRSGIKELLQRKYLYQMPVRNEAGQISFYAYISFPEPVELTQEQLDTLVKTGKVEPTPKTTITGFPAYGKTAEDSLSGGEQHLLYKSLYYYLRNNNAFKTPSVFSGQAAEHNPKATELFDFWNSLTNTQTHKRGEQFKTYRDSIKALTKALKHHSPMVIREAMQTLNNIIAVPHSYPCRAKPGTAYRPGLNHFFSWSDIHIKQINGTQFYSKLNGFPSMFALCKNPSQAALTLSMYAVCNDGLVKQLMEDRWVEMTGNEITAADEHAFITAVNRMVPFYKAVKPMLASGRISIGDLGIALCDMVLGLPKPHPGLLATEITWRNFENYLVEMGLIWDGTMGQRRRASESGS